MRITLLTPESATTTAALVATDVEVPPDARLGDLREDFARITGHQIWNPAVYAFDIIPNTMNPPEVAVILVIAVVASVLGAVVPAIAAARLNPVESLRWE